MNEDDLGTEARAILDAARTGDEPDAARVAHVRRRLSRNLGLAAGSAAAIGTVKGASAAASLGVAGWVKGIAVASLVIAGAGGAYVATRAPKAAPPANAPAVNAVGPSISVEVASPPPPIASAQPSASAIPRAVAPVPIAKSAPAVASSAPPSDDVAGEIALLQDAQLALNEGRYARAIELYDRHAATYPFGALVQERRAGLALALCGSKRSDATEVARKFLATNPSPPLAARVRTACHLGE